MRISRAKEAPALKLDASFLVVLLAFAIGVPYRPTPTVEACGAFSGALAVVSKNLLEGVNLKTIIVP